MSVIILEGMDGSGKTHLGLQLYEEFKLPLVKPISPAKYGLQNTIDFELSIFEMAKRMDIIMDRTSLISHAVYGNVLLKHNMLEDSTYYDHLLMGFLNAKPLVIYCRPQELNLDANPQMAGVKEHATELLNRYTVTMAMLSSYIPVPIYDYKAENAFDHIGLWIKKHRENPEQFADYKRVPILKIKKLLHGE